MTTLMHATQKIVSLFLVAATSLVVGYYFGSQNQSTTTPPPAEPGNVDQPASDEDSDDEDISDGDLTTIQAGFMEQCKMVLVVRTDLKMTPGKIAAQCGHATLACYKALVKANPALVRHWETTGQAKIALRASSEEEILELEAIAKSLNLCARSIQDVGRTQVEAGTRTVLAIGPAPVHLINQVTGHLKLL